MARSKKVGGAETSGQKDRLLCALSSGRISAYITITKSIPRITLKTEKKTIRMRIERATHPSRIGVPDTSSTGYLGQPVTSILHICRCSSTRLLHVRRVKSILVIIRVPHLSRPFVRDIAFPHVASIFSRCPAGDWCQAARRWKTIVSREYLAAFCRNERESTTFVIGKVDRRERN